MSERQYNNKVYQCCTYDLARRSAFIVSKNKPIHIKWKKNTHELLLIISYFSLKTADYANASKVSNNIKLF